MISFMMQNVLRLGVIKRYEVADCLFVCFSPSIVKIVFLKLVFMLSVPGYRPVTSTVSTASSNAMLMNNNKEKPKPKQSPPPAAEAGATGGGGQCCCSHVLDRLDSSIPRLEIKTRKELNGHFGNAHSIDIDDFDVRQLTKMSWKKVLQWLSRKG